ncbi:MAG: hypothetical protein AABZ53_00040 [Planctomycetota bacterium]
MAPNAPVVPSRSRAAQISRVAIQLAMAAWFGTPTCSFGQSPPITPAVAATIDAFDEVSPWKVLPADGVKASISAADRPDGRGKALRLEWNFEAGSGFVVVRKQVDLALPDNYRFTFDIRGESLTPGSATPPANNLEFKLCEQGEGGESVWWVNKRAYEWPADWKQVSYRKRHVEFAWGPSAGKPLQKVAAIEFAIAAAEGGKGVVWIDNLRFEPLAAAGAPKPDLTIQIGYAGEEGPGAARSPRFRSETLHYSRPIEIGGATVTWAKSEPHPAYVIELSDDAKAWRAVARVPATALTRQWIPISEEESKLIRFTLDTPLPESAPIPRLEIQDPEFASTRNAFISAVAKASPVGAFPQEFRGKAGSWTVVGLPSDNDEALLSETGRVEFGRQGWTLEAFSNPALANEHAKYAELFEEFGPGVSTLFVEPGRPAVRARGLTTDVAATGRPGSPAWVVTYTIENRLPIWFDAPTSERSTGGTIVLGVRPFQVVPPWHQLNINGGVGRVDSVSWMNGSLIVVSGKETWIVTPSEPPTGVVTTSWLAGEIHEHLLDAGQPASVDQSASCDQRLASAGLRFAYHVGPDEKKTISLRVRRAEVAAKEVADPTLASDRHDWVALTTRVGLHLPPAARHIEETFRAQQAAILINADGPAIQPGSRTYERSWIRDGSLTGRSLLVTGHPQAYRDFIDWYAGFQYPSGKIPCVVDKRGPDPVPEHDSHGEYIYAVWEYYRFTHDRTFLERHWPRVQKAVAYIEAIRSERKTDEYRLAPEGSAKRAMYGLVPESISHEGYSAKPMHSYWDDFFTLKGLNDAASIAGVLAPSETARYIAIAADAQTCFDESLKRAMALKSIDYIPGCVELGDFDATSTAIGVWPCGQMERLPKLALDRTFEKYWEFFQARRDGTLEWKDYTPYEIRIASTFTHLSLVDPKWKARTHELLDFFMKDQRPGPGGTVNYDGSTELPATGWYQWGEVVWRDKSHPGFIGDYPHTWVGSEFINAVRNMMVLERGDELVLAAGVTREWTAQEPGVRIENFPTPYGDISYSIRVVDYQTVLELQTDARPPGGFTFVIPRKWRPTSATVDGKPAALIRHPVEAVHFDSGRRIVISY